MKAALLGAIAVCSIGMGAGNAHAADVSRGWATGNGATYVEELEPLAEAAARGAGAGTKPGFNVFGYGRASGASSVEEAIGLLEMLSPSPSAVYMVAVVVVADGGSYSVGYVLAGRRVPETTVPAPETARPVAQPLVNSTPVETTVKPAQVNTASVTETTVGEPDEPVRDAVPASVTATSVPSTDVSGTSDTVGGETKSAPVLAEIRTPDTGISMRTMVSFIAGSVFGQLLVGTILRNRRRRRI
jgi:hypothetical protein